MAEKPWQQFFRDAPPQPGDEVQGAWTRERLAQMDERFCRAVERAIARGGERRPARLGRRLLHHPPERRARGALDVGIARPADPAQRGRESLQEGIALLDRELCRGCHYRLQLAIAQSLIGI
jgi:hypothetical protein